MNRRILLAGSLAYSLQCAAHDFQATRAFSQPVRPSPEWFGAAGDGISDDTTAVQRALNEHPAVWLTGGRSYLVRSLTMHSRRELHGSGATLIQDILTRNDGSPLIQLAGDRIYIENVKFDGNRSRQSSDGYSDSFGDGANRTGRSYRAAICGDGGDADRHSIRIENCEFREIYGACIALRHWSDVAVAGCTAQDCNFELLIVSAARPVSGFIFKRNKCERLGTGHSRVNANACVLSFASQIAVTRNRFQDIERNAIKLEQTCHDVLIADNQLLRNSTPNFAFLQVQSLGTHLARNLLIENNVANSVGAGFAFNTMDLFNVVIRKNVVNTTTGPEMGDGIQLANGRVREIAIDFNELIGIRRYGIVVGSRPGNAVSKVQIRGNRFVATSSNEDRSFVSLRADAANMEGGRLSSIELMNNSFVSLCGSPRRALEAIPLGKQAAALQLPEGNAETCK